MKNYTISECETLKKLDETVYAGKPAIAGTQYGDVTVRKALTAGYVAELGEGELPEVYAYGPSPAMALMNLGDVLRREESPALDNVLEFVLPAAQGTQEAA